MSEDRVYVPTLRSQLEDCVQSVRAGVEISKI